MSGSERGAWRDAPSDVEGEVMAAVDRSDGVPTYVIADVCVDDAWLSVPGAEALPLAEWR